MSTESEREVWREIAQTIIAQMGGRQFMTMAVKEAFVIENGIRFVLPRNKSRANRLDVVYRYGPDAYDMRFYHHSDSYRAYAFNKIDQDVKVYEEVYCDQLQDLFRETTQLAITIPRVEFVNHV